MPRDEGSRFNQVEAWYKQCIADLDELRIKYSQLAAEKRHQHDELERLKIENEQLRATLRQLRAEHVSLQSSFDAMLEEAAANEERIRKLDFKLAQSGRKWEAGLAIIRGKSAEIEDLKERLRANGEASSQGI